MVSPRQSSGRSEASPWGGGFEPEWASVSPAQLVILAAVEDAFHRQERRLDWGGGILDYKLRFAKTNALLDVLLQGIV